MENYNQQEAYKRAKKRLDELKGFYGHLLSYVLVIPFLIFINYMTYWEYKWFWWPMLGWGLGLAGHALGVFGKNKIFGKDWEERKIKEYMDKESKYF